MSRQDDLQKLITNYGRRLQKLREQQALRGLDTPPHILIEIEDVQAKITELEAKLVELRAAELEPVPLWTQNESIPLTVQSMIRAETQYSDASDPAIFIGRQAQLAELERHWQEVYYQQRGKIVFLVGEAGIGKTRLVQRFSHALLANYPNAQYASAGCDQLTGDISAYAPFCYRSN